jgi:hypothetical protein
VGIKSRDRKSASKAPTGSLGAMMASPGWFDIRLPAGISPRTAGPATVPDKISPRRSAALHTEIRRRMRQLATAIRDGRDGSRPKSG